MRRIYLALATMLTTSLLAPVVYGAPYDDVVGVNAPGGGALLVKRVAVPAGSTIVGVEIATNDLSTVFPKVSIYRGKVLSLSAAALVKEFTEVRGQTRHHVTLSCSPIAVRAADDFYVAVQWPPSDGVAGIRNGAGIPVVSRAGEGDSYIASSVEKELQRIEGLDLGVRLLVEGGAAKADALPDADPPVTQTWRTFFEREANVSSAGTTFRFGLEQMTEATLEIYDVTGRLVHTVAHESFEPGEYTRTWDGRTSAGALVASGVYIARLTAGPKTFNQKVVVAR